MCADCMATGNEVSTADGDAQRGALKREESALQTDRQITDIE